MTDFENALWVDVNTGISQNRKPDRLTDAAALQFSSIFNLLNCVPGQRGRIFQPEYGSYWLHFVHEPINEITASKMASSLIGAIARWEPRVRLDTSLTSIVPDLKIPGYRVRLAFDMPSQTASILDFTLKL